MVGKGSDCWIGGGSGVLAGKGEGGTGRGLADRTRRHERSRAIVNPSWLGGISVRAVAAGPGPAPVPLRSALAARNGPGNRGVSAPRRRRRVQDQSASKHEP